MSIESKSNADSRRFQFRLRTVLIVITAACVLLGLLAWLAPSELPRWFLFAQYVEILVVIAIAVGVFYWSTRQQWRTPTDFVLVKVDARWERRVKSPYIFGPIAALTGVSRTFAPLGLLLCGQVQTFGLLQWVMVVLCFLVIYFVPGFYMRLAFEVIAEMSKPDQPTVSS